MDSEPISDVLADVRQDGQLHSLKDFIQPHDPSVEKMSSILEKSPDFVKACQDFVHELVKYEMSTVGVWITPDEVLSLKHGDCEKTAVLLVSLLRTQYSGDEVFVVVGLSNDNGKWYGHAWAELQGDILESTNSSLFKVNPTKYRPYVKFNDYKAYGLDSNPFGYIILQERYGLKVRK